MMHSPVRGYPPQQRYFPKTGDKFGRLTLVSDADRNAHGQKQWMMRCDCGTEKEIAIQAVLGSQVSCGCANAERIARLKVQPTIDLTGRRIGKLTVLRFYSRSLMNERLWLCHCDCGCGYIGVAGHLLRGAVQSCGCTMREMIDRERTPAELRKHLMQVAHAHQRRAKLRGLRGKFSAREISDLLVKQRNCCASCKRAFNKSRPYTRDHKIPLALGGTNDIGNIELLCGRCNSTKSAKHPVVWAQENGRLL